MGRREDVYRPYQHVVTFGGHETVFAAIEMHTDDLPEAIEVAGVTWVRQPSDDDREQHDGD